jgi:hypothetical protein
MLGLLLQSRISGMKVCGDAGPILSLRWGTDVDKSRRSRGIAGELALQNNLCNNLQAEDANSGQFLITFYLSGRELVCVNETLGMELFHLTAITQVLLDSKQVALLELECRYIIIWATASTSGWIQGSNNNPAIVPNDHGFVGTIAIKGNSLNVHSYYGRSCLCRGGT